MRSGEAEPVVVVAVSPRGGSPDALGWAARHAAAVGARLSAVTAWRLTRVPAAAGGRPPATEPVDAAAAQRQADRRLRAAVRDAIGDPASVVCRALRGRTLDVLLAATVRADLLVLGAPRARAARTRRPALTARQLIYRASCPVVVMPPDAAQREATGRRSPEGR